MAKDTKLLKVILLGDGGVGKSSIMSRFVNNKFDDNCYHTIGVEFLNKDIVFENQKYTLQIWDTAGQERFRSLRTPFYRGSDMCILTFALDDEISFKNLETWRREFFYYGDVKEEEGFPFLLIGNKCDIPDEDRKVTTQQAISWCKTHGITGNLASPSENGDLPSLSNSGESHGVGYIETSAKSSLNITQGFMSALRIWQEHEKTRGGGVPDLNPTRVDVKKFRLFRNSQSGQGAETSNNCC